MKDKLNSRNKRGPFVPAISVLLALCVVALLGYAVGYGLSEHLLSREEAVRIFLTTTPVWYMLICAVSLVVLLTAGRNQAKNAGRLGVVTGCFFIVHVLLSIYYPIVWWIVRRVNAGKYADSPYYDFIVDSINMDYYRPVSLLVAGFLPVFVIGVCVALIDSSKKREIRFGGVKYAVLFAVGAAVRFTALCYSGIAEPFGEVMQRFTFYNVYDFLMKFDFAMPLAMLLTAVFVILCCAGKNGGVKAEKIWFVPGTFYLTVFSAPVAWLLLKYTVDFIRRYLEDGFRRQWVAAEATYHYASAFSDIVYNVAFGVVLLMFGYWFVVKRRRKRALAAENEAVQE